MNEQTSLNSGFHAERDEEKRYYLKYNVPSLIVWGCSKNPRWLHVVRHSGYSFICEDRTDHENVQTIFTESEIAEMDITGFEKIRVMNSLVVETYDPHGMPDDTETKINYCPMCGRKLEEAE